MVRLKDNFSIDVKWAALEKISHSWKNDDGTFEQPKAVQAKACMLTLNWNATEVNIKINKYTDEINKRQ